MSGPSEEKSSPEQTERFFLELGQILDSPPLSEEFHERIRQRFKRTSSSTGGAAQAHEIPILPSSARKAAQSNAGKQSNWWKGVYFFGGATAALVVLVGFCWLEITNYEIHSRMGRRLPLSYFITDAWHLQEIKNKDPELHQTMLETIDKIRYMLNNKKDYNSKDLIIALEPLVDKLTEASKEDLREEIRKMESTVK